MKKGKLLVFSAPSGTGKTTIVRNLLDENPDWIFSISATTREKRGSEIDGKDYFFISEDEFINKINAGEFVEWERFYDYYYGTLKKIIDDHLQNGKIIVFEVDVKGALKIKNTYPDAVLIFIAPPSIPELKDRLRRRKTESEEDLKKRFDRIDLELSYKDKFDFLVVNDDLESAIKKIKEIVKKVI
ncbi:MAG: guanylate kinase [Melioribacteraceae bacterium]|nr:guanylate kinase [Melioribacteraceae bacterium]MCO6473111.1 guanylate kinase [Melioribacteraceae bacterium]MDD3556961.1 guanylate kinase [Melioribacteraceae bacterium]